MEIIPAIDLRGGKVVRLVQGDPARETRYAEDPVEVAREWQRRGARRLHVVDLDGALHGRPGHDAVLASLLRAVAIPVQVGGGLRSLEAVARVLDLGAAVAILGTAAIRDPGFLELACARFPDRIAFGLDARGGLLSVSGWAEGTTLAAADAAARASHLPLAALIYTDIARDGMLAGPDLDGLRAVARAAGCRLIASGGIGSPEHIRALRALEPAGVWGAILGKALYDGRLSLADAMATAEA
ncbi:MAG: 1-(5-phosphoribosyl)-5-[(5-phosphoribosylamino)methylideneamino]imidazole-4-carboxamide isomerase [Candidatus Methylomirabilales bacterium]